MSSPVPKINRGVCLFYIYVVISKDTGNFSIDFKVDTNMLTCM